MTGKTKLILLVTPFLGIGIFSFVIFFAKVSGPRTISIQNSDDIPLSEPEVAQNNSAAPDAEPVVPPENTTDSATPEKMPEKIADPEINTAAAKKLPVTNYELPVTKNLVSWGFSKAANRKIDTIIIHSSYNALGGDEYDTTKLIAEYKEYGVATHYLIDRQGKIYQLVAEKNIAYHAGESKVPDERTQVNNFSLGIEMMNTKEDKYTSEQYASLNDLLSQIKSRYSIKYVLGHDDIAPGRKTDPWNFDWKKIK